VLRVVFDASNRELPSWLMRTVPPDCTTTLKPLVPVLLLNPFEAAALTWQNVPYNPNGQPVEFFPQQIDPTIQVTGAAQNPEPVLWLLLKPDTVLGLANVNTGEPNWVRPPQFAPRWRSITLPLATGGIDLSRVEFLEFWVWEDNQRVARENRAGLLIDIGSMFEDALAWVPDSFTIAGGDTTYHGQRFVGQGRLDTERDPVTRSWNAALNDEGFLTDRVVDGIYDVGTGTVVDTLPLCSATLGGRPVAYGLGDLRSRCGRDGCGRSLEGISPILVDGGEHATSDVERGGSAGRHVCR
jgi:hypothetical protein